MLHTVLQEISAFELHFHLKVPIQEERRKKTMPFIPLALRRSLFLDTDVLPGSALRAYISSMSSGQRYFL